MIGFGLMAAAAMVTGPAAARTPPVADTPAAAAVAAAADPLPLDMPAPPEGAAPGFVPPPRDEAGYRTPNRDLAADEAVWHLRVALNVAALQCRGAGDEATATRYDSLVEQRHAALLAAHDATQTRYRIRRGPAGEAAFDDDMTRLYNYFAQPPARSGFCAAARIVLDEAGRVPEAALAAFAPNALAALEAPFTRFYAAYDGYRSALAAWQARRGRVVIATAAPVAVGPAAILTPP